MTKGWNSFLSGIIKMPGAKVDREAFLRKSLKGVPEEQLRMCLISSPAQVLPAERIEKAAAAVIRSHTLKVTAISTASGIPGGIALLATIPADLANYYYHVVTVGQKLGYLYGFPEMVDAAGNLTADGSAMLTAFIGVMNKVQLAGELIKKIAVEIGRRITEETASRIAGNILSKQIVAQAVEVIAAKLGTQITSRSAGRALTKAVPVVSGLICGGITLASFRPQARRLQQALREAAQASPLPSPPRRGRG